MSGVNPMDGELDIDVASLFKSLWRNKGKILFTSLVLTGLTAGAVLMVSPKYKAQTKVLITVGETKLTSLDSGSVDETRPILDAEGVKSQVELMNSGDVLSTVVDKLKLSTDPEFDPVSSLSVTDKIMNMLGRNPELGLKDSVIAKVRDNLNIYLAESTRVIVIEFSSKNPTMAAAVPQAIAEAYLDKKRAEKQGDVTSAIATLKPEIDRLKKEVQQNAANVAAYRSEHDILMGQNNTALSTQSLSELSTEMSRVKAARANAEAKAQSIRAVLDAGGSIDSVPEVLSSNLMQQLRNAQVTLKSQIADLSTTLLDSHPRIKGLRSQLADLDGQIRSEASKILKSLETEAKTAALRESELQSKINGSKAESSRVGDDEVELQRLEEELKASRSLLADRELSYKEAQARSNLANQKPDAKISAPSMVPSQSYFPKLIPIVSATFVASLLLLSIITLLRELFSGNAVRTKAGLVAAPVVEVVGGQGADVAAAPVAANAQVTMVQPTPQVALMEEDTTIDPELSISAVASRLINEGATCAVVISPEGDEASASSILLTRNISDQGLKVILLDLTANSAAARPMTDGLALAGITNLLAGSAQFGDIIHNDVYSDAHVIPTGTGDTAKAARAVERLPMIINALVSAYDMVIVECGPTTARGVKRLVVPGSGLLVSVVDIDHKAALAAMTDLIAAGYDDLILVSPLGSNSHEPMPDRYVA
jgi:uncharacterized protein involved in exopolysaccharide biosynthesis/Mrp family chromosome partitioning ATPase